MHLSKILQLLKQWVSVWGKQKQLLISRQQIYILPSENKVCHKQNSSAVAD